MLSFDSGDLRFDSVDILDGGRLPWQPQYLDSPAAVDSIGALNSQHVAAQACGS